MTSLAESREVRLSNRRLNVDSAIIYGLFTITLVLLVASGITGWLEAQRRPVAQAVQPIPVTAPQLTQLAPASILR